MPNQRRNRGLELGVLLLMSELFKIGFNSIPPVTLSTIVGEVLLYIGIINVPWSKLDVCLSGAKIWYKKDWRSFILSNFEHADDMHLYYNMISFLFKGRSLESKYGSPNFLILLIILCMLTPGIYVILAVVCSRILEQPDIMKSCAIGFSGVIFALKLITTVENRGYTYIQGFQVPLRYSAWFELLAIHILVPNASFLGHLAGILAGIVYMKTPFGKLIDKFISFVTGEPMRHINYGFREDFYSTGDTYQNQNYDWRDRSNMGRRQYGFREDFYSTGFQDDRYN